MINVIIDGAQLFSLDLQHSEKLKSSMPKYFTMLRCYTLRWKLSDYFSKFSEILSGKMLINIFLR